MYKNLNFELFQKKSIHEMEIFFEFFEFFFKKNFDFFFDFCFKYLDTLPMALMAASLQ
jgi:hypothetical protein